MKWACIPPVQQNLSVRIKLLIARSQLKLTVIFILLICIVMYNLITMFLYLCSNLSSYLVFMTVMVAAKVKQMIVTMFLAVSNHTKLLIKVTKNVLLVTPHEAHIPQLDLCRLNPFNLANERMTTWPNIVEAPPQATQNYNNIRETGLPNMLKARIPIRSGLSIQNWRAAATGHHDDHWLCELIEYGFPLQYTGSIPKAILVDNHPSAVRFPDYVNEYI